MAQRIVRTRETRVFAIKPLLPLGLPFLFWFPGPAAADGEALARSAEVLRVENRLTIGFLGGSITHAAGKGGNTSWRTRTTQWFRDRFPAADIRAINAGYGGTGTWQGAYRVGLQLLQHEPDLVFVEFAVNDTAYDLSESSPAMEGIVRQIRRANPRADIVFVYTAMSKFEPDYRAGRMPATAAEHEKVALHYGIPSVDAGKALWDYMRSEGKSWDTLLPDGIHPTVEAFGIYAEAVADFLQQQNWDGSATAKTSLPARLNPAPYEHRRMVESWNLAAPGWTQRETPGVMQFPRCLAACEPGTELVYHFSGRAIGLYLMRDGEGGTLEWSLNGSPPRPVNTYITGKRGPHIVMLGEQLPPGEHELRIQVSAAHHPDSAGTAVRIGGFLLDEPPDSTREKEPR